MRILCPHCHAEGSRCPEVPPECRVRGDAQQRVIAEAVTRATAPLRAENARLRAEVQRLRAELTVPARPRP